MYCAAFSVSRAVTSNDQVITSGASVSYIAGAFTTEVVISGLFSIQSYNTYCSVVTVNGVASIFSDTQNTKRTVTTACCKLFTFTNAPTYVYGSLSKYTTNQKNQYVFSYSLSSAPQHNVQVVPVVWYGSSIVSNSHKVSVLGADILSTGIVPTSILSVFPNSTSFSNSSASLVGSFVLSAASSLLSDSFHVVLTPVGDSSFQYQTTSTDVSVVASNSIPPPPVLFSAKLSNSGAYFDITFTSSTDRAGFGAKSFSCDSLFTFVANTLTTCSWFSSTVVRATFGTIAYGAQAATINDLVNLKAGMLKTACEAGAEGCSLYLTAQSQSVPLLTSGIELFVFIRTCDCL